MSENLKVLITALTSSGFMSLVLYLVQRHDRRRDKEAERDSLQNKMLLGLAHDRILFLTKHIIERGAITAKEKTNLRYLYLPYEGLGGNGDCKTGYEVCDSLPVVSEKEAADMDLDRKRKEYSLDVLEIMSKEVGGDATSTPRYNRKSKGEPAS
jgi:hypothetical protein